MVQWWRDTTKLSLLLQREWVWGNGVGWGWGEGVFIHPELFLTLSQFPDYFIPLFLHL